MKQTFFTLVLVISSMLGMAQSPSTPMYRSKPLAVNTNDLFAPPPKAPQISWERSLVQVQSPDFVLKACVQNKAKQLRLEVNGESVPSPANTRSFVPEGTFCAGGITFSQPIKLRQGKNNVVLIASNAAGETRSEPLTIMYEKAEKRLALVIGNGDYPNGNQLANPANDAGKIADKLRNLGFEVMEHKNTSQSELRTAVSQFGNKLQNQKYDVALFYYAGHGLGVGDKNYLLPVDIKPQSEGDVKINAVSANDVLDQMSDDLNSERTNVVILDACRDNPLTRSWKSSTRGGGRKGLVEMAAPQGSLICYATQPGSQALDGAGNDSPYTEELLKALDKPNLSLISMFMEVRAGVWKRTKQLTVESNMLSRDVILNKAVTK